MKQLLHTILTILWQCFVPCFVQTLRIVLGVASFAVFVWLALGLIVLTLTSNMDHGYAALDCGCVIVATVIACRAAKRVYFPPRSVSTSADGATSATTASAAEESGATTSATISATPGDPRASLYRPLINPNVNDKTMWL